MVKMTTFGSHEEWLQHRTRIGGSDAASIIGLNPWRTNVQLWELKTGRRQQEDISDKPYVRYGNEAEQPLRYLFALDFPEYNVFYKDGNMWRNDRFPWAHASLDGWLEDENGRKGILEIKTSDISSGIKAAEWDGDKIPDNYYVQVMHYLMVTEFDFVVLKAQLKYDIDDNRWCKTKHYHIEREDVIGEIDYLREKEHEFWQHVINDTMPALILPEL